jgi:release factor glutamine methyltransferase
LNAKDDSPVSRTISNLINEFSKMLGEAGIAEPRLTAGLLLAHVIHRDRAYLYAHPEEELSPDQLNEFNSLIARRAAGEPLQYITGHQEFYGLDFEVTPAVLIPRPETELIVEQALKLATPSDLSQPRGGQALIIDVGTGSGCIAVTLAVKLRWARVIATDISRNALDVARLNARKHGVDSRIEFIESDLFDQLQATVKADFIVSNPPYVPMANKKTLQREVKEHEPHLALFAEEEGLQFYRRLLAESARFLDITGLLIIEIGINQLPAIENLAYQSDWRLVEITNDLQGIPRTLTLTQTGINPESSP